MLFHILPALILDLGLKWSGRKHFLAKLQRRIYTANKALEFFILHSWNFQNQNFMDLNDEIKPEDYKSFAFDSFKHRDVRMFIFNCCLGARRYLLKEKDEDLPKAKKHYVFMQYIDKGVKMIFWILIIYYGLIIYGTKIPLFKHICNQ